MKLLLSRCDLDEVPWLDEQAFDFLRQIAASVGESNDVVEVTLTGDEFIRRLNRDYRGVDNATDVLSFSYMEDNSPVEENIAGELYVSYETVEKEAKEQAVDPKHLFLRVALHGLLHVVGYEHGSDEEVRKMEEDEKRILGMILHRDAVDSLF